MSPSAGWGESWPFQTHWTYKNNPRAWRNGLRSSGGRKCRLFIWVCLLGGDSRTCVFRSTMYSVVSGDCTDLVRMAICAGQGDGQLLELSISNILRTLSSIPSLNFRFTLVCIESECLYDYGEYLTVQRWQLGASMKVLRGLASDLRCTLPCWSLRWSRRDKSERQKIAPASSERNGQNEKGQCTRDIKCDVKSTNVQKD